MGAAERKDDDRARAGATGLVESDTPRVLLLAPESCTVTSRGVVLQIRRAVTTSADAIASCRAVLGTVERESPRGVVLLNVFRLSPRFPVQTGFDANLGELAGALRAIEPVVPASAVVLELGGVRALMMRAAVRAVWAIARPRTATASFDTMTEAIEWLVPYARVIGAADDAASYVRLYRHAQSALDDLDAARAAPPR